MKRFLVILVSLTLLPMHSLSLAQENTTATTNTNASPNPSVTLLDQYIERYNKADAKGELPQFAKRRYDEAVAAQIATLEPEDFNLFMLYLISDRYMKNPKERKALTDLVNAIPKVIAGDIQVSGVLDRKAWLEYQSPSSTETAIKFVAVLVSSTLPWKRILTGSSFAPRFVKSLGEFDTRLRSAGGFSGTAYSWTVSRVTLGGSVGLLGVQYLSYEFAQRRTYRQNPQPLLAIAQLGMACDLEIKTAEIYAQYKKNRRDKSILPDVKSTLGEALLLSKQNPELNSYIIRDEPISQTVKKFPSEMSTELQQRLGSTMNSSDRTCSQVSLLDVASRLVEIQVELEPPTEDTKPEAKSSPEAEQNKGTVGGDQP